MGDINDLMQDAGVEDLGIGKEGIQNTGFSYYEHLVGKGYQAIIGKLLVTNIDRDGKKVDKAVEGVTKRKGYNFKVSYGEGNNTTTVTLNTGATLDDEVIIVYDFGSSMVEREFSRSDVKLPRVVMMFLTGSEEPAALNDDMADGDVSGKGSYFNVSYRVEIRDKYANRARVTASKAFNLGQKLRRANLFRTNITNSTDMQNFDFDIEKHAYVWQFTINIQWEIIFE